jgi:hypothetical protein
MTTLEEQALWQDGEEGLDEEVLRMSTEELLGRTRLLENEIRVGRGIED